MGEERRLAGPWSVLGTLETRMTMARGGLGKLKERRSCVAARAGNPHDRRMLLRFPAVLAALLASTAAASAATTGSFSVAYDGYAHGLMALKLSASLTLTPSGYSGRLAFRTAGMVAWMVRVDSDTTVSGQFDHDKAMPYRYDSTGSEGGRDRETRMSYRDGSPVIEVVTPPPTEERTAVPLESTRHTIDTLSAIVQLIHGVAETGKCEGSALTFDGRRLTALAAHTAGPEQLEPSRKTHFNGQALRCNFDGNQLAGFKKDKDEAILRKTRHGTAWLADMVPGAPPVPVRVVFENDALGTVTLYLTSMSASPATVAQAAPMSRVQ
jgi:hypothetical protein